MWFKSRNIERVQILRKTLKNNSVTKKVVGKKKLDMKKQAK